MSAPELEHTSADDVQAFGTGDGPDTAAARLTALEARVHEDLAALNRPPADWVPKRTIGGEPVRDVMIVGGGMCGLVAWQALQAAGIRDVRIIDRAPAGREGPWVDYARMETLRSPKQLTGPASSMASLTFRAWFTARFGTPEWDVLDRIPRRMWMDYLGWYARTLQAPVENGVTLRSVRPEQDCLRLELDGAGQTSIIVRRLVLATGRDGTGRPAVPGFMDGVPRERWAHSSEDIDFNALAGRRVAVVGVGASAIDNAAEALEAGAREVRMLIRRTHMPTVNKMMGIGSYGFLAGYPTLSAEWRWRFMHYSFATQTPAPHGSTLRVGRHANAHFHFDRRIDAIDTEERALSLRFDDGATLRTDHLILGTGFLPDPAARPELGDGAAKIRLWRDAYEPPAGENNAELGSYPWLGADFSFTERESGSAPWLSRVHCFNYGAVASLGKVSGDIPGIGEGADWLARELAAAFYREDVEQHWAKLQAYDSPELRGDEWVGSALPAADDPIREAIEQRDKIFVHDAQALRAVLSPRAPGALSRELRHALALRVARLSRADKLATVLAPALARCLAERGERIAHADSVADYDDGTLCAMADPAVSAEGRADEPLRGALLDFVDAATLCPGPMGRDAIDALRSAGLGGADIVRLTGLVAYFAWRVRLLAGLDACGVSGPVAPGANEDPGALQPLHELGAGPRFTGPAADATDDPSAAAPSDDAVLHDFTLDVPHWQPRVGPVELSTASDEQREALGVTPSNKPVSEYVLVLAHDPETLAPRSPLFNAVMYIRGGASRADRELATTVVSKINGCVFCAATHASRLVQLTKNEAMVQAVLDHDLRADADIPALQPRERAIAQFARRLTLAPHEIGKEDIDVLRQADIEPAALIDLVLSSALFGWANRLMHLLGDPVAAMADTNQ